MSSAYSDLYIEQGTTFATTINISDVYGNPYDLNNYLASSQMRSSYYSSSVSAVFDPYLNVNLSTITLKLDSANTSNILPGRYVYDAVIKNINDGSIIRILEGTVTVSPSVTR